MVNNQWSLVIFLVRRGAPFRELLRGSEREIELNELPLMLQHSYQIDRHNEFRGLGSKTCRFFKNLTICDQLRVNFWHSQRKRVNPAVGHPVPGLAKTAFSKVRRRSPRACRLC